MKCLKCSKNAEISIRHIGNLCKYCFLGIIEKRVRKGLRIKKLIRKNDRILFVDDGSKEAAVGDYLLKSIIKGLPVRITKIKTSRAIAPKTTKEYDKAIIPWSLDDECEEFLNMMFNKNKMKKTSKKTIKLLKNLSEDEIEIFAKIRKLSCKQSKRPKIKQMLDKLEQRYPGYKFSLLKSIEGLSSEKQP